MPRIVVSTCIVSRMREIGSTDPIHVAHNGVDQNDYYPSVSDDHRKGIGTVYHGAEVKDPNFILSVLNKIHHRINNVPIYVFGSFPRPKGLPEKAVYVRYPSLEQARDLYSRSLVWFMGSQSEGFGNPLLEGMACGCAIASTDCGGPADFIESGKNGFLTPVGNIDAMTSNIEKLLEDKALRETFIHNCEPVLDRFSWSQAVEDFESAICSCVNDKT